MSADTEGDPQGHRGGGPSEPVDVVLDGERVGSVDMNGTIEVPVEPGRHTVQVRDGRKSRAPTPSTPPMGRSSPSRCTGKRFLPIF